MATAFSVDCARQRQFVESVFLRVPTENNHSTTHVSYALQSSRGANRAQPEQLACQKRCFFCRDGFCSSVWSCWVKLLFFWVCFISAYYSDKRSLAVQAARVCSEKASALAQSTSTTMWSKAIGHEVRAQMQCAVDWRKAENPYQMKSV